MFKFSRRVVRKDFFERDLPVWVRLAIRRMPDPFTVSILTEETWPGGFWKWPGL